MPKRLAITDSSSNYSMRESTRTCKLCRVLEAQGAMTFPIIGSRNAPVGWPDRIVIHAGLVVFLELKIIGQDLEPHQAKMHERLRAAGANVDTAWLHDDRNFIRWLKFYNTPWVRFDQVLDELHKRFKT